MNIPLDEAQIVDRVLGFFPSTQAVVLFGSAVSGRLRPESDIDLAVLLPPLEAKAAGFLGLSELQSELETALGRDIDLINLQRVSTILQKEVIMTGKVLMGEADFAFQDFAAVTISMYQKLNQERREIVEAGINGGRFYL